MAILGLDCTQDGLLTGLPAEEIKSTDYHHFYHPNPKYPTEAHYRFAQGISIPRDEPRVMFLEVTPTTIRIYSNPSDDSNKYEIAQMQ